MVYTVLCFFSSIFLLSSSAARMAEVPADLLSHLESSTLPSPSFFRQMRIALA